MARRQLTLRWLLDLYLEEVTTLAPRTLEDYHRYVETTCGFDGNFGQAPLSRISMRTIRAYLDNYPASVMANRHVQFIKAAWNFVLERRDIPGNPCLGVRLNPEEARDRYVNPDEYALAYRFASEQRVPHLAVAMEFAYLLLARKAEVPGLRQEDILERGILVRRRKKSQSEVTLWSPRLEAAAAAAGGLHPTTSSPWVLHNADGQPIRARQVTESWKRLMRRVVAEGVEPFTFHDLKAAGITDHPNKHGGHKSAKMRAAYDRLPADVKPTR